MTSPIETNNVVERLRADADYFGLIVGVHPSRAARVREAADLIQSLSDRIDVLEGAGNTLAETVKLIKHILVANLTKRELEIVMGDLHAWNVASLSPKEGRIMDKLTEHEIDEQRREAITRWWKRKSLNDFIARVRARTQNTPDSQRG